MAGKVKRQKQARVKPQGEKVPDEKQDAGNGSVQTGTDKTTITMSLPRKLIQDEIDRAKISLTGAVTDELEANGNYGATLRPIKRELKELETQRQAAAGEASPAAGEKVASIMARRDRLNAKMEEVTARHKLDLAVIMANQDRLQMLVASGVEYVPVACEAHYDYDRKVVTIIRTDTGEQVDRRAMIADELQMQIPTGDGGDD